MPCLSFSIFHMEFHYVLTVISMVAFPLTLFIDDFSLVCSSSFSISHFSFAGDVSEQTYYDSMNMMAELKQLLRKMHEETVKAVNATKLSMSLVRSWGPESLAAAAASAGGGMKETSENAELREGFIHRNIFFNGLRAFFPRKRYLLIF